MKKLFTAFMVALFLAGIIGMGISTSWSKESPAEFYRKNPITVIIGFSPGGGTDYVSRLFANYWPKVTGGSAVAKNMGGAGGIVAANYVNARKPDGLTMVFGMYSSTFVLPKITRNKAAKYDPSRMNFIIGGMHEPFVIHISAKKPYETVEDLMKAKNLKMGAVTPYGDDAAALIPFLDFMNIDAKLITGYEGGSRSLLAAAKGEIDMVVAPASTGLLAVKKGFVKPAFVVMDYKRCPIYPDAPAMIELTKFTRAQEAFFKVSHQAGYILRTGAVAPGVPADRVKYMRDAFRKVTELKEFQDEAMKKFPMGPTPIGGEKLDDMVREAGNMDFEPIRVTIKKFLAVK
jgi:tripartite-type tricarboxylate transporter receptor subunit TctC